MPLNYNNGKIYKIINPQNEIIYIGSTAQEKLCKRFSTHKHRGNGNKIILIEEYPCSSKEQLCMKEQDVIEQYDNLLNQLRAYRTEEYKKEYYKNRCKLYREENKNELSEKHKKYRETNRDKLSEKHKKWNENNKEKVKEYKRNHYQENREKAKVYYIKHYQENRDKISEKNKIKVMCDCGCEIRKDKLVRHMKTKKHIKLMNTIKE